MPRFSLNGWYVPDSSSVTPWSQTWSPETPFPLVTPRSVQRRVVAATGLTQSTIRQIERARLAALMLREGQPAADVAHRAGYYDQPHMTRSLKRFLGLTATQLQRPDPTRALSLLYKTDVDVRP